MKTSFFLPLCFSIFSAHAFASGQWPDLAVARAQERLRTGPCPLATQEKPAPLYLQDLCRQYALKNQARPDWRLRQRSPSLLQLQAGGRQIQIERDSNTSVYKIEQSSIDLKGVSAPELQVQIEKSLRSPKAAWSLWITPAYADVSESELALTLQMLITETQASENCQLYLDFGAQCLKGTREALRGLKKNPANETELSRIKQSLSTLQGQIKNKILAPLEGYDLVRQCSYLRDPRNGSALASQAETHLKDCQFVLQEIRRAIAAQPGKREKDLDGIESMISGLYNEKAQSPGSDKAGKYDGVQ